MHGVTDNYVSVLLTTGVITYVVGFGLAPLFVLGLVGVVIYRS